MNTTGIRILDNNVGLVSVELPDILQEIDQGELFHWSILFFYGTGHLNDGKTIPAFEEEIKQSERGMLIKWEELNSLSNHLWDVFDMLIIGCKDPQRIARYEKDKGMMFESCDIVIKMFDSSFWEVFSKDENLIHRLAKKFMDVKLLKDINDLQYNHPNPHQHRYENSAEGPRKRKKAELLDGWEY